MIYLMGFFLMSFGSLLFIFSKEFIRYETLIIKSVVVVLALFAALRWGVGTDWDAYYNFYKELHYPGEPGYNLVNNIFSSLAVNYSAFLFIVNVTALSLMAIFLLRHSYIPLFAFLIFYSDLFLYLNFSGIRQAISLSIALFAYQYAERRDLTKFVLFVLLAASFHVSALAFSLVYVLPRQRMQVSTIVFLAVGIFAFAQFFDYFVYYIDLGLGKNMAYYVVDHAKGDNIESDFLVGIIRRSIILFFVALHYHRFKTITSAQYILNIYVIGFIIYLLTYMISADIGVRVSLYFTFFEVIIASNLLYSLNRLPNRVLFATAYLMVCFYKIYGYSSYDTYIYNSILFFGV